DKAMRLGEEGPGGSHARRFDSPLQATWCARRRDPDLRPDTLEQIMVHCSPFSLFPVPCPFRAGELRPESGVFDYTTRQRQLHLLSWPCASTQGLATKARLAFSEEDAFPRMTFAWMPTARWTNSTPQSGWPCQWSRC